MSKVHAQIACSTLLDEDQESEISDAEMDEFQEDEQTTLSKKKWKKLNRPTVALLKTQVSKPELVDWIDCCASDPKLVVELKGVRNSVPIPQHWQLKRKYLASKRGTLKRPFELPDFIRGRFLLCFSMLFSIALF